MSRRAKWRAGRIARLMERDGDKCWICKRELIPSQITFDHIVPKSHGGKDRLDNLALACRYCNQLRGAPDRPLVTWVLLGQLFSGSQVQISETLYVETEARDA